MDRSLGAPGEVVGQQPEAGEEVAEGSTVEIFVSEGPAEPVPAPDDTPTAPKPKPKPKPAPAEEKNGGWPGLLGNTYSVAKTVCGEAGRRQAAVELGLPPSAQAFEVAEEYAKGSTAEHRQPAFEGCLDALLP